MMRIATILGDALGERFNANARQLADVSGLTVLHHDLRDVAACIYAPSLTDGEAPVVSISRRVRSKDREAMIAIALGHLFAGHHRYQLYVYDDDGPLFDAPAELDTAKQFARHFLRAASASSAVRGRRAG